MRVSSVAVVTLCLSAGSLSSASTLAPDSGVCALTVTCLDQNAATAAAACSANATADFKLVARSLQGCKDISYFFTEGQPWPINDKSVFCKLDAPCGKLVPFLRNTEYLSEAPLCDKFAPFAGTIATFRAYCRGQPVQQIADDNGLLRDLTLGNGTAKPTPAPTTFNDEAGSQTVSAPVDTISQTSGAVSMMARTSMLLATLAATVVVATTA